MDLVNQQYWNESYTNIDYHIADDAITEWLDRKVLQKNYAPLKTVFELGCFPGRYLAHLGIRGLEISGMDLTPSIEEERFKKWLLSKKISVGKLSMGDVLHYAAASADRFDMVCSFGFIEHFKNYLDIAALHDKLLKPGGLLVITTPNFRGPLQKALHHLLDRENLGRHYLPSMHPAQWANLLAQKSYKIHYSGYFGGFDFWHDNPKPTRMQQNAAKLIGKIKPIISALPSSPVQSPFCGLIAQKPEL